MNITIPELVLYQTTEAALSLLRRDYELADDKRTTVLHQLFGEQRVGRASLLSQALALFCPPADSSRQLSVHLGQPATRPEGASITVLVPAETSGALNGIGLNPEYEDLAGFDDEQATVGAYLGRSFDVRYHLYLEGQSALEVTLLYHALRAALILFLPALEERISNLQLGGLELQLLQEPGETPYWARVLAISGTYQVNVFAGTVASQDPQLDFARVPAEEEEAQDLP